MSDGTPEFKKSTLQRKDRNELNQIAEALDLKAPSSLRKAEVVELILDAVSDDAPAADTPGADPQPATTPTGSNETAKRDDNDDRPAGQPTNDGGAQNDGRSGGSGDKKNNDSKNDSSDNGGDAAGEVYHAGDEGGRGRNRDQGDNANRKKRRRRSRDRGGNGDNDFSGEPSPVSGHLDLRGDGYGFLRTTGFVPTKEDPYISVKMVREFNLRPGDHLAGEARPANRNEKNPAMLKITSVNGGDPAEAAKRPHFDNLTPLFPDEPLPEQQERSLQHGVAHHRSVLTDRQRPARAHRVAAQGRQDHGDEEHRLVDRDQQP